MGGYTIPRNSTPQNICRFTRTHLLGKLIVKGCWRNVAVTLGLLAVQGLIEGGKCVGRGGGGSVWVVHKLVVSLVQKEFKLLFLRDPVKLNLPNEN